MRLIMFLGITIKVQSIPGVDRFSQQEEQVQGQMMRVDGIG